jgi:hypothetical protein
MAGVCGADRIKERVSLAHDTVEVGKWSYRCHLLCGIVGDDGEPEAELRQPDRHGIQVDAKEILPQYGPSDLLASRGRRLRHVERHPELGEDVEGTKEKGTRTGGRVEDAKPSKRLSSPREVWAWNWLPLHHSPDSFR